MVSIPDPADKLKRSLALSAARLKRSRRSPDEMLGDLFADVQRQKIFADGKTFVDLKPVVD